MLRLVGTVLVCCGGLLLLGGAVPQSPATIGPSSTIATVGPMAEAVAFLREQPAPAPLPIAPVEPPPPAQRTTSEALEEGVLIVVSIPSQRMFVFRRGELWDSSPVSTGKPGDDTPTGVFPILQKRVDHRSNLYDNAPMPYMQRLTWGGVALHGGHVPGYPASHGCIRLPTQFARKLYEITDFSSTMVLVVDEPVASTAQARALGGGRPNPSDALASAELAQLPVAAAANGAESQTIQLSASATPQNAAAFWQQLTSVRPQLRALNHEIIPATVNGRRVFRLRATGPNARSICAGLTRTGVPCIRVG